MFFLDLFIILLCALAAVSIVMLFLIAISLYKDLQELAKLQATVRRVRRRCDA